MITIRELKLTFRILFSNLMFYQIAQLHSFIHYVNLYSASSRVLLRSAPDSSMAKKSSFKARVECVGVNPGEQSKPIPNRGTNHRECTSLAS